MEFDFEFAYGIGPDSDLVEPVNLVHRLAPELKPFYLISCAKLVSKCGNGFKPITEIALPDAIRNHRLMLDSGGFSFGEGTLPIMDLRAERVASMYADYKGPLCISPDAPMWDVELYEPWWVTKGRQVEFYANYRRKPGQIVYDVIQGETLKAGGEGHSLDQRDNWRREMLARAPEQCDGYAVRPPGGREGIGAGRKGKMAASEAQAFFAMQPWSWGAKNCHLLAIGGFEELAMCVYIGEHVYEQLSADAKSHTIDTQRYLIYRLPDEFGVPRIVTLKDKKFNRETFAKRPRCECPICVSLETEHKTTILYLATANQEGRGEQSNRLLRAWLVAHNIVAVEGYLKRLRSLVKDRDRFLAYLRSANLTGALRAIAMIDKLLAAGSERYKEHLVELNAIQAGDKTERARMRREVRKEPQDARKEPAEAPP